jgi:hypothetical protein
MIFSFRKEYGVHSKIQRRQFKTDFAAVRKKRKISRLEKIFKVLILNFSKIGMLYFLIAKVVDLAQR